MLSTIKVHNVSKTYRMYQKPIHRLLEALTRKPRHHAFECLQNLSFELSQGGTLGIIGENGAGKSTLLKILAGTLTPSTGRVQINGRVAALLELGSGFHQEFTGRQNIYLNASLQGLTDTEIQQKEPAIIDFADIGSFIDRPIKTYSSGMTVRLAFSIATSIDPDILIIDEALSVGDQRFQQKCIERMIGFRHRNKTLVICSHSMYLVNELCAQTIWLQSGQIRAHGDTSAVIASYLAFLEQDSETVSTPVTANLPEETGRSEIVIEQVFFTEENGQPLNELQHCQSVLVRITTVCFHAGLLGHLAVGLESGEGKMIFVCTTRHTCHEPIVFAGRQAFSLFLPSIPFSSGSYRIKAVVGDEHALMVFAESASPYYTVHSQRPEFGMIWMDHHWII